MKTAILLESNLPAFAASMGVSARMLDYAWDHDIIERIGGGLVRVVVSA